MRVARLDGRVRGRMCRRVCRRASPERSSATVAISNMMASQPQRNGRHSHVLAWAYHLVVHTTTRNTHIEAAKKGPGQAACSKRCGRMGPQEGGGIKAREPWAWECTHHWSVLSPTDRGLPGCLRLPSSYAPCAKKSMLRVPTQMAFTMSP